jgi:TPR repeat protein
MTSEIQLLKYLIQDSIDNPDYSRTRIEKYESLSRVTYEYLKNEIEKPEFQFFPNIKKGVTLSILALYYYEGMRDDFTTAAKLYQQSADLGCLDGITNLGVCYSNGDGVEQNLEKALKLYTRAIELNDATATYNLGVWYMKGKFFQQNHEKALELFEKSGKLGRTQSIFDLAHRYEHGNGVQKDLRKSAVLYHRAFELGDEAAISYIDDNKWISVFYNEIVRADLYAERLKVYTRLNSLDIGSLVYYDIKKYI